MGWEDPLEKGKATHSSILVWRIHGLYNPWGPKKLDTTEQVSLWASLIAQLVKNLPAVQETLVRFLGWEDLLKKG